VNRGEVWDSRAIGRRLVVSPAAYNTGAMLGVITALVHAPPNEFRPFTVTTRWGTVYADMVMTHPLGLLDRPVGRVADDELTEIDRHLRFAVLGR
jgi:mRNA-degrading endonuclease toxin of MazEF toxin-antitoxin module